MNQIRSLSSRNIRAEVSDAEWEARVNLAAFYRLLARYGMTDLAGTHISMRVPGTHDQFLINGYGVYFDEMTASSLYKVDVAGKVLLQPDLHYLVNEAGFTIHSAIHMARHDVDCVVHTHTRAGIAVSCMKEGLMMLNQTALRFDGQVAYHDFEGPAVDHDERDRLVASLGNRTALILRNHGLLCVGRNIPEAFMNIYALEQSCKVQVDIMNCRTELHWPSEASRVRSRQVYTGFFNGKPVGETEWEGQLRWLDRTDPSYRD